VRKIANKRSHWGGVGGKGGEGESGCERGEGGGAKEKVGKFQRELKSCLGRFFVAIYYEKWDEFTQKKIEEGGHVNKKRPTGESKIKGKERNIGQKCQMEKNYPKKREKRGLATSGVTRTGHRIGPCENQHAGFLETEQSPADQNAVSETRIFK